MFLLLWLNSLCWSTLMICFYCVKILNFIELKGQNFSPLSVIFKILKMFLCLNKICIVHFILKFVILRTECMYSIYYQHVYAHEQQLWSSEYSTDCINWIGQMNAENEEFTSSLFQFHGWDQFLGWYKGRWLFPCTKFWWPYSWSGGCIWLRTDGSITPYQTAAPPHCPVPDCSDHNPW